MRAVCWQGKYDIRIGNVPDPKILTPRDVILRVTSTAICGSDLHLYAKTIPGHKEEQVDLVQPAHPLFGLRLVVGSDTLSLADWEFTPSSTEVSAHAEPAVLQMVAERGGVRVSLGYRFRADNYRIEVDGWTPAEAVEEMQHFGYHDNYKDMVEFVKKYEPRGYAKKRP